MRESNVDVAIRESVRIAEERIRPIPDIAVTVVDYDATTGTAVVREDDGTTSTVACRVSTSTGKRGFIRVRPNGAAHFSLSFA